MPALEPRGQLRSLPPVERLQNERSVNSPLEPERPSLAPRVRPPEGDSATRQRSLTHSRPRSNRFAQTKVGFASRRCLKREPGPRIDRLGYALRWLSPCPPMRPP